MTGEGSGAGGSSVRPRFKGEMGVCSLALLGIVICGMGALVVDEASEASNGCEFGVVEFCVVSLWSAGLVAAVTNADFIVCFADEQLPNPVATNHLTRQQAHQNQTCIDIMNW